MLPEPKDNWSLADWLDYQERLHPKAIELGLERVRRVAQRLGVLDRPPVTLTIGGTNGKGSSSTLASLIYREAGYRVGTYTSPHLFRYNERVALDGEPVADALLCAAFQAVEAARAGESLTYFEFGTLAALWVFRDAKVDVQVLEVGLGGRLDAVNLLDADAALVTNVGLDHRDWLGPDRDAIGAEKAGIFRRGRPALTVDRDPPQGLLQAAEAIGAKLIRFDQGAFSIARHRDGWIWSGLDYQYPALPMPGLPGAHQLDNAAGVLAAITSLQPQLPVTQQAIQRALPKLKLSGRLQRRGRFLLDVAHNAEATQALHDYLEQTFQGRPLLWIAGILADKPVESMAAILAPCIDRVICCDLPGPRGLTAMALAARLRGTRLRVEVGGSPQQTLMLALALASPDQPILICGSFLTVAAFAPLLPDD